jgi:hypothetical protein
MKGVIVGPSRKSLNKNLGVPDWISCIVVVMVVLEDRLSGVLADREGPNTTVPAIEDDLPDVAFYLVVLGVVVVLIGMGILTWIGQSRHELDFKSALEMRGPFCFKLALALGLPVASGGTNWKSFLSLEPVASYAMDRLKRWDERMGDLAAIRLSYLVAEMILADPEKYHLSPNCLNKKGYAWCRDEPCTQVELRELVASLSHESLELIFSRETPPRRIEARQIIRTESFRQRPNRSSSYRQFYASLDLAKDKLQGIVLLVSNPPHQDGLGKGEALRDYFRDRIQFARLGEYLWVNAQTASSIEHELHRIGLRLITARGLEKRYRTEREIIIYGRECIQKAPVLLLYRPGSYKLVESFSLLDGQERVKSNRQTIFCITSSPQQWEQGSYPIASHMIFYGLSIAEANAFIECSLPKATQKDIGILRQASGLNPLCLELLVGIVQASSVTAEKLIKILKDTRKSLFDSLLMTDVDIQLATIVQVTLDHLKKDHPVVLAVLNFSSLLRNHNLPDQWVDIFLEQLNVESPDPRKNWHLKDDHAVNYSLSVVIREMIDHRLLLVAPDGQRMLRKVIKKILSQQLIGTRAEVRITDEGLYYIQHMVRVFISIIEEHYETDQFYPYDLIRYCNDLYDVMRRYFDRFKEVNVILLLKLTFHAGCLYATENHQDKAQVLFQEAKSIVLECFADPQALEFESFLMRIRVLNAGAITDMEHGIYEKSRDDFLKIRGELEQRFLETTDDAQKANLKSWRVKLASNLFEVSIYLGDLNAAEKYLSEGYAEWFVDKRIDLIPESTYWEEEIKQRRNSISLNLLQERSVLDVLKGNYTLVDRLQQSIGSLAGNKKVLSHLRSLQVIGTWLAANAAKDGQKLDRADEAFDKFLIADRHLPTMAIYCMILFMNKKSFQDSSEKTQSRQLNHEKYSRKYGQYLNEIVARKKELTSFTFFQQTAALVLPPMRLILSHHSHINITSALIAICCLEYEQPVRLYFSLAGYYESFDLASELADTAYALIVAHICEAQGDAQWARMACMCIVNDGLSEAMLRLLKEMFPKMHQDTRSLELDKRTMSVQVCREKFLAITQDAYSIKQESLRQVVDQSDSEAAVEDVIPNLGRRRVPSVEHLARLSGVGDGVRNSPLLPHNARGSDSRSSPPRLEQKFW